MGVRLTIPYGTLLSLVDQLPEEQQRELLRYLQRRVEQPALSTQDKMRLLRAAQLDTAVNEVPSPRREDWYDDDTP